MILKTEDTQVFKDHITVLFQNIAKRNIGPTLKDFLIMLKKLLLKENNLDRLASPNNYSAQYSNKESQKNTPLNTPKKFKASMRSYNRLKTDVFPSLKLDSLEDENPNINKQKSIKSSRVYSQGIPSQFREKGFLAKSIKLMDTCKLLVNILKNLKDQKDEFLCIKQVLDPEGYDHKAEIDDFITLILHLLFNFLIEEAINERNPIEIPEETKESQMTSSKNISKNRFSLRSSLTTIRVIESLDNLLPDSLGPKTMDKLLDTIRYSIISNLNFESYLIMICFKRVIKMSEKLLLDFLKAIINLTSQYEQVWLKRLRDLPNFMAYLSVLYNKLRYRAPSVYNEQNLLLLESFINRFLFFLFYQENALKYMKLFILNSPREVLKGLEISLNLIIALMDKFLNESNSLIFQWKKSKDEILFEPEINQMIINMIHFLNFIESLSYLSSPAYLNNAEILQIILKYLEKIIELFENLDLIYMILPELLPQKEEHDFQKLWDKLLNEAIKDEIVSRPGGIFHGLISVLFNIISYSLIPENVKPEFRIRALSLIVRIITPLKNLGKKAFENSNQLFKKLFSNAAQMLDSDAFGLNPHLSTLTNIKFTRTSIEMAGNFNRFSEMESNNYTQQKFYDIVIYKVLDIMNCFLNTETSDEKFLNEIIFFLKEILENCGIDYNSKITNHTLAGASKLCRLNSSLSSSSSFKENSYKKDEFLEFGKAYNQEYSILAKQKFQTFYENMPVRGYNDITLLKKTEAFDFEVSMPENYSKSVDDGPTLKIELINALQRIIENNYSDKQQIILEFLTEIKKLKEEINNIIEPILYLNAYRPLRLVEKMNSYRLKVYLNQNQSTNTNEFPKNYCFYKKRESHIFETFQNCERDSLNINEKFTSRMQRKIALNLYNI